MGILGTCLWMAGTERIAASSVSPAKEMAGVAGACEGHSPKGVLYYLMAAGQLTEGTTDPSKLSKPRKLKSALFTGSATDNHARPARDAGPSITAGKLPVSRVPPGETGEIPDSSST